MMTDIIYACEFHMSHSWTINSLICGFLRTAVVGNDASYVSDRLFVCLFVRPERGLLLLELYMNFRYGPGV